MQWILPVIVISQFFCTSLWFSGNAVMPELVLTFQLAPSFSAHLTSAVQMGFISGTLFYAVLALSDRFSPSRVFFVSSILAGIFNLGLCINEIHVSGLLVSRFFTGFFLAGIYPVGMKILSDYYNKGLDKPLGFLVGALVLGTAFPHLLKSIPDTLPWKFVVFSTSALSAAGGLSVLVFVPDGHYRTAMQKIHFTAFLTVFKNKHFRSVSIGYFGHSWELYAFWTFVPVLLATYKNQYPEVNLNIPLLSFLIIGMGGVACVIAGYISQIVGARKTAVFALSLSGICCLVSPLFLNCSSVTVFIAFLLFWGMVVIADSPLFSSLIASHAPEKLRGTSLTIVNCIGFFITIISIQLLNFSADKINARYMYWLLAIGPAAGLVALLKTNPHCRY